MGDSRADVPGRVVKFPIAPESGHPEAVSTTLVATCAEAPGECAGCGKFGTAKIFRTVHAVYFFCSSCGYIWD